MEDKILFDKLEAPIIFFDIETSGVDIKEDRIVEICAIKYTPSGDKIYLHKYINPKKEVSKGAFDLHNLSNEFLQNYPTFKECCDELYDFFIGCDLGGYNCVLFDIPMLYEEFYRCRKKLKLTKINIIDSYNLLNKYEPRTLKDVYRRFFGKDIQKAHSAKDDVEATIDIFKEQLNRYNLTDSTLNEISNIVRSTSNGEKIIDLSGWFRFKDNDFYYGRGKFKGSLVKNNLNYLKWLYESNNIEMNSREIGKYIYDHLKI